MNKNAEDDTSELTLEGFPRNHASQEQELITPQKQQQDNEAESDEEPSRSYLPQQLESKQDSPKLSQLQEKWNQSFGSSTHSANTADSDPPVAHAKITLPSIQTALATPKVNTPTSASTPPPKVHVTTTTTGKPVTTPPRTLQQTNKTARTSAKSAVRRSARKSPKRASSKTASSKNNNRTTPVPPDMNAGLYYFAQMGPEQAAKSLPAVVETYQGSCQCGELQLEVRLPNIPLEVETTDESAAIEEKIHYRYIQVKQSDFKVTKGQANLSTYFVTMRAPPVLSSSTASISSATSSTGSGGKKSSKFFVRPNSSNTSPRSQSKAARLFCPQCGVNVLYVPGKNAPRVHLNINCFPTLSQEYPPPPPPPPDSKALREEAWYWDYKTYSRYVTTANKEGSVLDWCWQFVQEHLGDYLPLIHDFVRGYLWHPSSNNNDYMLESMGFPSDTPRSVKESVYSVEMAFQGTLTPSSSFLEDEEGGDVIMGDIQEVFFEDGSFNQDLLMDDGPDALAAEE